MKYTANLLSVFGLVFLCLVSAHAQTTKYDRGGNLSFIGGLLTDATGCEPSRTFSGSIAKISNADSDEATGYDFTLKLATGKPQRFNTAVPSSNGELVIDFAELMVKGRKLSVKARECGSGGFWTVEEIRRL